MERNDDDISTGIYGGNRRAKEWDDQYLMPMEAKKIQLEVMEMCDQMEYDGSPMFDCYPDRIIIGRMVQKSVENGVMIHITMHWYRSCCVRR